MGYLFLSLALAGGLIKGFTGRAVSRDVDSLTDGFTVNLSRCIFSSVFALVLVLINGGLGVLLLSPMGFLVSMLSALFMAMFSIAWLYAYKSEAYVFLSVFTMLGSVATAMMGFIFYGDELKITRVIGMVVLFLAVYVMSLYNKGISGKITLRGGLTLAIGGVGVALADFMQKVFTKEALGSPYAFNFYTYFMAVIPQLLILFILTRATGERVRPALLDRKHIVIYIVISAALYMNSVTKTLSLEYLPSTQVYPTLQALNLIASAVLAVIFLKEKMTRKSIIGIALALVAGVLMNI